MTDLHATPFGRGPTETYNDVTAILAVALAVHGTDGRVTAVGATFLLLSGFRLPLTVAECLSIRSSDS